jgi:hypothetical protein
MCTIILTINKCGSRYVLWIVLDLYHRLCSPVMGTPLGTPLGDDALSTRVGDSQAPSLGDTLCISLGDALSDTLGTAVGHEPGLQLGDALGIALLGHALGRELGPALGLALGTTLVSHQAKYLPYCYLSSGASTYSISTYRTLVSHLILVYSRR